PCSWCYTATPRRCMMLLESESGLHSIPDTTFTSHPRVRPGSIKSNGSSSRSHKSAFDEECSAAFNSSSGLSTNTSTITTNTQNHSSGPQMPIHPRKSEDGL